MRVARPLLALRCALLGHRDGPSPYWMCCPGGCLYCGVCGRTKHVE